MRVGVPVWYPAPLTQLDDRSADGVKADHGTRAAAEETPAPGSSA